MQERISVLTFQREKLQTAGFFFFLASALFCVSRLSIEQSAPVFGGIEPIRSPGINSSSHIRSGLEAQLLLIGSGGHPATLEMPLRLGSLRPKGRVNPDGSEVWGYPEGSALEDVVEVHVKDGRVVREVLRPSSRSSAPAVAGVLSSPQAESSENGR